MSIQKKKKNYVKSIKFQISFCLYARFATFRKKKRTGIN